MKELKLVYLWMLLVTVAGCAAAKTQTGFDISDPADQQAMWAARDPLQLHLVNGDSLEIRRPRVERDSLLFLIRDEEGETGYSPHAVPVDSIDALVAIPGVPRGKYGGAVISVVGFGLIVFFIYAGMKGYSGAVEAMKAGGR